MTSRGVAVAVLAVLVVAIGVLAAVLIPWHEAPAPRADQMQALRSLPAGPGGARSGVRGVPSPGDLRLDRPSA